MRKWLKFRLLAWFMHKGYYVTKDYALYLVRDHTSPRYIRKAARLLLWAW